MYFSLLKVRLDCIYGDRPPAAADSLRDRYPSRPSRVSITGWASSIEAPQERLGFPYRYPVHDKQLPHPPLPNVWRGKLSARHCAGRHGRDATDGALSMLRMQRGIRRPKSLARGRIRRCADTRDAGSAARADFGHGVGAARLGFNDSRPVHLRPGSVSQRHERSSANSTFISQRLIESSHVQSVRLARSGRHGALLARRRAQPLARD